MSLIKTKNDTDFNEHVISIYRILKDKFEYSARITRLYEMIQYSLFIDEFQLLDTKVIQNGNFESFLLEKCISWNEGKEIDFEEIYKAMLINGDFSYEEKSKFKDNNIEEVIWAIFLVIFSPDLNFKD